MKLKGLKRTLILSHKYVYCQRIKSKKEKKKGAKRPFRAAECDISQVRVVLTIRIPMGQFARQYLLTHNVAKHRVDSDILLRSLRLRLSETA